VTAAAQDRKVEAVLTSEGVDLNQHPQARRVDEPKAPQIHQKCIHVAVELALKLLLEAILAREVKLACEAEDRRPRLVLSMQRTILAESGQSLAA
jgi:hypothetical protein